MSPQDSSAGSIVDQIEGPSKAGGSIVDDIEGGDSIVSQIEGGASTDKPWFQPEKSTAIGRGIERFAEQSQRALMYGLERAANLQPGLENAASRVAKGLVGRAGEGGAENFDKFQREFTGASGRTPTYDEFERVAIGDPEFAGLWNGLKGARDKAEALAKATHGAKPNWGHIKENYVRSKVNELGLPDDAPESPPPSPWQVPERDPTEILHIGQPAPDPMLQPIKALRNTDRDRVLHGYAEEADKGAPGLTRPPPSNEELATAAWSALKAESAADIESLPGWVKAPIRGATAGGKFGLLARMVPGGAIGGALVGMGYEALEQGLGLASGAQKELEPGKVLLSGLLMSGAGKAGKAAEELLPLVPGANLAAQLMTFKAAETAGKIVTGEAGEKDERSRWQQLGEFVLETGTMLGVGGFVAGHKPRNRVKAEPQVERVITKLEARQAAEEKPGGTRHEQATNALRDEVMDFTTAKSNAPFTPSERGQPPIRPGEPEPPTGPAEVPAGGAKTGLVSAKDDLKLDIAQAKTAKERTRLATDASIDQYAQAYELSKAERDSLSEHAHSLLRKPLPDLKKGAKKSALPAKTAADVAARELEFPDWSSIKRQGRVPGGIGTPTGPVPAGETIAPEYANAPVEFEMPVVKRGEQVLEGIGTPVGKAPPAADVAAAATKIEAVRKPADRGDERAALMAKAMAAQEAATKADTAWRQWSTATKRDVGRGSKSQQRDRFGVELSNRVAEKRRTEQEAMGAFRDVLKFDERLAARGATEKPAASPPSAPPVAARPKPITDAPVIPHGVEPETVRSPQVAYGDSAGGVIASGVASASSHQRLLKFVKNAMDATGARKGVGGDKPENVPASLEGEFDSLFYSTATTGKPDPFRRLSKEEKVKRVQEVKNLRDRGFTHTHDYVLKIAKDGKPAGEYRWTGAGKEPGTSEVLANGTRKISDELLPQRPGSRVAEPEPARRPRRGTRGSAFIPSKEDVMLALFPDWLVDRMTRPKQAGMTDYAATNVTFKALKRAIEAKTSKLGIRGEPPERIQERGRQIEDEYLSVQEPVEMASDKLNTALDAVAGKTKRKAADPVLRALVSDITRKIVESDGRIPVPENIVLPEQLRDLVKLQRDLGVANLGVGRLLAKYDLMPQETLAKREAEGFYFPQVAPRFDKAASPEAQARFKGMSGPGAPLEDAAVRGHLQKRQKTFEEAFAERPLDTSVQSAYEIVSGESDMVRKKAWLDLSRQGKDLLTAAELPDALGMAEAKARADAIPKEIAAKRASKKGLDPLKQMQVEMEIANLTKERIDLLAASKNKLYKKLVGKVIGKTEEGRVITDYGEYEGMWMHRDALAEYRQASTAQNPIGHVYKEFHTLFKSMKVGFAIHQWLQDWLGNTQNFRDNGVNAERYYAHSAAVNLGKGTKNAFDYEFDAQARRAWLGGPGDITKSDRLELRAIERDLAKAKEQDLPQLGLRVAKLVADRGKLLDWLPYSVAAPFKVLALIPKGRQALVDGAQNRAAYHELREHGIGDSGPMGPAEAFDYLAGITNYQRAPRFVQGAANFASFARWSWMVGQAAATRAIRLKPSVFGKSIPTPMDSVIAMAPGSPAAQAALVLRGVTRLASNAARYLVPLATLQQVAASAAGISMKTLNNELDDKYRYLPAPLAWLVKKTQIPTGRKTALGRIEVVNVAGVIPSLVAMQYASSSGATSPLWWQALQKNVVVGPLAQGIASRDYQHRPIGKGFGIGEQWWPLISSALPATPLRSLEAYFAEQNVPEEERSAMRSVMRTLVGVPMSVLTHRSIMDKEVERLVEQGTIQQHAGEGGSWYYYVPEPDTVEGLHAQMLLDLAKEVPSSLYDARMTQYRQQQNALERAGLR